LTTTCHHIAGFLSSRYPNFRVSVPLLAPYWLSAPAMTSLRSSRCSHRALVPRVASRHLPLLPLDRVQSVPRAALSRTTSSVPLNGFPLMVSTVVVPSRPSHGVSYPSAISDTGSDLHRVFQPRLCCVLRFSQPLDAFFRPFPSGPVSYRYHPGFSLQRFSLPDSLVRLATSSVPLAVSCRVLAAPPTQLQGLLHSGSPFRLVQCYPVSYGRSSPDVYPFEVFLSWSRRPCGCLLSWASARCWV